MSTAYSLTKSEFGKELRLFGLEDLEGNVVGVIESGIGINDNSDKKEKAVTFIEYMLSDEVQKTRNNEKRIDGISVKTDCMEEDAEILKRETDSLFASQYKNVISKMERCIYEDDIYIRDIFIPNLFEYKSGHMTIDELAGKLEQESDAYLGEADTE